MEVTRQWKIFPKIIYVVDNLEVDKLEEFKDSLNYIRQEYGTKRTEYFSLDSTRETCSKLHEMQEFQTLAISIERHLKSFAESIGYTKDVGITDMWVNYSKNKDYNPTHLHGDSFLSGVYYVQVPLGNKLYFIENPSIFPAPDLEREDNQHIAQFEIIPGRLIIFKSDLLHASSPSYNQEEKIAISFNSRLIYK
jgi:uncharacterized protein (TIGR02466 family)